MGMLTVAPPKGTAGGVKASSSETLLQWSGCLQVHRERDWVGATFGNPRAPEKAQRRLGGLQIKRKKKKKKNVYTYDQGSTGIAFSAGTGILPGPGL